MASDKIEASPFYAFDILIRILNIMTLSVEYNLSYFIERNNYKINIYFLIQRLPGIEGPVAVSPPVYYTVTTTKLQNY